MQRYILLHTNKFDEMLKNNFMKINSIKFAKSKQVKSMQCWEIPGYLEDEVTGELFEVSFLQSYNTLVAVAFVDSHEVWVAGKWTPTTSRQVTIWKRKYL